MGSGPSRRSGERRQAPLAIHCARQRDTLIMTASEAAWQTEMLSRYLSRPLRAEKWRRWKWSKQSVAIPKPLPGTLPSPPTVAGLGLSGRTLPAPLAGDKLPALGFRQAGVKTVDMAGILRAQLHRECCAEGFRRFGGGQRGVHGARARCHRQRRKDYLQDHPSTRRIRRQFFRSDCGNFTAGNPCRAFPSIVSVRKPKPCPPKPPNRCTKPGLPAIPLSRSRIAIFSSTW